MLTKEHEVELDKLAQAMKNIAAEIGANNPTYLKHHHDEITFNVCDEEGYEIDPDSDAVDEETKKIAMVYREVQSLACGCLITSSGQPNFSAHRYLERHGLFVRPGEQDSFGWLTGVLTLRGSGNQPWVRIIYG